MHASFSMLQVERSKRMAARSKIFKKRPWVMRCDPLDHEHYEDDWINMDMRVVMREKDQKPADAFMSRMGDRMRSGRPKSSEPVAVDNPTATGRPPCGPSAKGDASQLHNCQFLWPSESESERGQKERERDGAMRRKCILRSYKRTLDSSAGHQLFVWQPLNSVGSSMKVLQV